MEISYIHVRRGHKKGFSYLYTPQHWSTSSISSHTLVCYHLDSCLSLLPQSGLQSASHHQTLSHYHSKVCYRAT